MKTDKELWPSYDPANDRGREDTTFTADLMIAMRIGGLEAVKETFNRAFNEWKDNIKYLLELCVATNHLCWKAHHDGDLRMSEYLADCYHKCNDYAFSDDTKFTEEERTWFYRIID